MGKTSGSLLEPATDARADDSPPQHPIRAALAVTVIGYVVLTALTLGKVGDSHYMPYAYRFDVYPKGMAADRVALEKDWQPWLDGTVAFDDGIRHGRRS